MDRLFNLPYLGQLKTKSTDEIHGSNWLIGCETLDRDYADYDEYKKYLKPLGIKILRLQGGWAKTEKKRGVYDWKWLDHIIDDAVSRGLRPWLQTGYGNSVYPGAGGENLGAGMPLSEEGSAAFERWVTAMVTRYRDKVTDWEVWNEPNFADNSVNTPEITADFNIRTAKIIRNIQPNAQISCLSLGHFNMAFVEGFFKYLSAHDGVKYFDNVTYHDYAYNPDGNRLNVYRLKEIVNKYAPNLKLRQGENGCPSVSNAGGALGRYPWTELSQAKWDVRRMLENLGNDVECSIFSIADMQYRGVGPIHSTNTKGLLETNSDKQVVREKLAYHGVQNVTAIFDDSLIRLKDATISRNDQYIQDNGFSHDSDRSIAMYAYENKNTKTRMYSIWRDDEIPRNDNDIEILNLAFRNSHFVKPVVIDVIHGTVYQVPKGKLHTENDIDYFKDMPVYDSPIVITDLSAIKLQ